RRLTTTTRYHATPVNFTFRKRSRRLRGKLSGKASAVSNLLAAVAGEDEQSVEGQLAFATVGAHIARLRLGMGALHFIGLAPPETAVSLSFFYFFHSICLNQL